MVVIILNLVTLVLVFHSTWSSSQCSTPQNDPGDNLLTAALKSGAPVDYVKQNHQEKAPTAIDMLNSNSNLRPNEMRALFAPTDSQEALYLTVTHVERAGLGHTLTCFGKYLEDAIRLNLTYYSPFYTTAHCNANLRSLQSQTELFGLHDAFFRSRQIDFEHARLIHVNDCNTQTLESVVTEFRTQTHSHRDTVFVCHNGKEDFQKRHLKSGKVVANTLRLPFRLAYNKYCEKYIPMDMWKVIQDRSMIMSRSANRNPNQSNLMYPVNIVVHIRRGDALDSENGRVDKDHRLIPYRMYQKILDALMKEAKHWNEREENNHDRKIYFNIFLLCEGSPNATHIRDFDKYSLHHINGNGNGNINNRLGIQPISRIVPVCKTDVDIEAETKNTSRSEEDVKHIYLCLPSSQHLPAPESDSEVKINSKNDMDLARLRVLWNATDLNAFSAMCSADVLIGSPSAFSWSAAVLCDPPMVIGVGNFDHDYEGVSNVVVTTVSSVHRQRKRKRRLDIEHDIRTVVGVPVNAPRGRRPWFQRNENEISRHHHNFDYEHKREHRGSNGYGYENGLDDMYTKIHVPSLRHAFTTMLKRIGDMTT